MLIRTFEGSKDSIKSVATLLHYKGMEICIRKVNREGLFAISVNGEDYMDAIELTGKHLPKNIAKGINVIAPDGTTKSNLYFFARIPFLNPRESKIVPVFDSEKFESANLIADDLTLRGKKAKVTVGYKQVVWVDQKDYVSALVLGTGLCAKEGITDVRAISPDRAQFLDKEGLQARYDRLCGNISTERENG